jgi:hypothetical protein
MDLANTFQEAGLDWKGWEPVSQRYTESQIERGLALINNDAHLRPHRHEYAMMEAITTTDFPNLFGVIIDRELMAQYGIVQPDFASYTKIGTVSNFNQHTRDRLNGPRALLPRVGEKGEYLVSPVSDTQYTRQVYKLGRQFDISWESLVNDGMGAFDDIAADYAKAALNTEYHEVTGLYAAATGPDPLLFGAPIVDVDGVNVTNLGALALTIANLETTMELMASQTDVNGLPLNIRGMHLVVPSALEFTARAILTSALKQWTEVGAGGGIPVPTTNVVPQMGLQLHINPWLAYIDTSGNVDTTWYLFADTGMGYAIGFDRLRGHEGPEICMKASDKVAVGGGPISPFDGDFATDNVFYRVRQVQGGNYLDPRFAYAQVG